MSFSSFVSILLVSLGLVNSSRTTPTLNTVYPKPSCSATTSLAQIRYSSTSDRIYVEHDESSQNPPCITVGEVWESLAPKYPDTLHPIDELGNFANSSTGKWMLNSDLYVLDGVTLRIRGISVGGDADEFRLVSSSEKIVNLRAHGGSLDIDSTRIFSWDSTSRSYDEDIEDGRSFISCLSEILTDHEETCEGRAKNDMGEGRMDITNSEISYLGYDGSESWGLSWKVRGCCAEKTNPEVFGLVGVYGNMYDSDIHHNYYGQYSYGHRGGDWSNNTVHDNYQYGFDPHDYSSGLTIHDNTVYNNMNHGIIASKWCSRVSIQGNEVFTSLVGIFLHLGGDFATVKNNYVHDNRDAGITLLESSWATISDNIFERNLFGTRISVGSKKNTFTSNSFSENLHSVNLYEGSDIPQDLMSGRPTDNLFYANDFVEEGEVINAQETDGLQFVANTFYSPTLSINLEDSTAVLFKDNKGFPSDGLDIGFNVENSCFDPLTDLYFDDVVDNLCESPGKVLEISSLSPTGTNSFTLSPTLSPTGISLSPTASPTGISLSPVSLNILSPTPQSQRAVLSTMAPTGMTTTSESTTGILFRRTTTVLMVAPTLLVLLFA